MTILHTDRGFWLILLLLYLLPLSMLGQEGLQTGFLPSFNFNKTISESFSLNAKAESRLLNSRLRGEKPGSFNYQLTDYSLLLSRKVGIGNLLSAGYLFRNFSEGDAHRLIQQFTLVRQYPNYRLAHRIASDQTFGNQRDFAVRLRYRVTVEKPLNGERVNRNEFYLKLNNEYLNAEIEGNQDLEIRIIPAIGYLFNDNNKLEAGLDYRIDGLIFNQSRHRLWLAIGWFVKI